MSEVRTDRCEVVGNTACVAGGSAACRVVKPLGGPVRHGERSLLEEHYFLIVTFSGSWPHVRYERAAVISLVIKIIYMFFYSAL